VELERFKTIVVKHISEIFSNYERERSTGITETHQKGHGNKCWKERGMKHTRLDRWTCASGKCMILRHK
jgi:hypothetical protein